MATSEAARPPAYAWDWLQRSRPVVGALAGRLIGRPPSHGFVDEVRAAFTEDPFVRAVVLDTIAEVAFAGRVPAHRPARVTWDRGLTWWAAQLAGTTPRDFDGGREHGRQPDLFGRSPEPARSSPSGSEATHQAPGAAGATGATGAAGATGATGATGVRDGTGGESGTRRPAAVLLERRRLAGALRRLLEDNDGRAVPADAVRQLLHDLESLG